jgi:hypothetical protein
MSSLSESNCLRSEFRVWSGKTEEEALLLTPMFVTAGWAEALTMLTVAISAKAENKNTKTRAITNFCFFILLTKISS